MCYYKAKQNKRTLKGHLQISLISSGERTFRGEDRWESACFPSFLSNQCVFFFWVVSFGGISPSATTTSCCSSSEWAEIRRTELECLRAGGGGRGREGPGATVWISTGAPISCVCLVLCTVSSSACGSWRVYLSQGRKSEKWVHPSAALSSLSQTHTSSC